MRRARAAVFRVAWADLASTGLAAALVLASAAAPAEAQVRSRQVETEAEFVAYDAERGQISVRVLKPGEAVKGLPRMRSGERALFRVVAEGSVLTRTTLKLQDGRAGSFGDLEAGRRLRVFWIPDAEVEGGRFARSIAVYVPAEEQGEAVD